MRHVRNIFCTTKRISKSKKKGVTKELSATILESARGKSQDALKKSTECEVAEIIISLAKARLEKAQDSYDFGFVNGLNTAAKMVVEYEKERR